MLTQKVLNQGGYVPRGQLEMCVCVFLLLTMTGGYL